MQVIGHEAARNDCEVAIGCTSHNLPERELDTIASGEVRITAIGAKGEDIPAEAYVVERRQTCRVIGKHEEGSARRTPNGPPEGGHYIPRWNAAMFLRSRA